MYCPTHFEETRPEILLDLIAQYPLATLISQQSSGLVADHIPFLHQPAAGTLGRLIGHVARNNPIWQTPSDQEILLVFQGPNTYISPNWYASKADSGKVVPTWNYAVVHAYGSLTTTECPEAILSILTRLTDTYETAQNHPWQVADAPAEFTANLLKQIIGIEITLTRLMGKWKVSQNQPPRNQQSLIQGLQATANPAALNMAELVAAFGETPAR